MSIEINTYFYAEKTDKKTGNIEHRTIVRKGRIDNEKRCKEIADSILKKTGFKVTEVAIDSRNYQCDAFRQEIDFCDDLHDKEIKNCLCCYNKTIFKY